MSNAIGTTDFFTARNSYEKSSFKEVIVDAPRVTFDELPSCPVVN